MFQCCMQSWGLGTPNLLAWTYTSTYVHAFILFAGFEAKGTQSTTGELFYTKIPINLAWQWRASRRAAPHCASGGELAGS